MQAAGCCSWASVAAVAAVAAVVAAAVVVDPDHFYTGYGRNALIMCSCRLVFMFLFVISLHVIPSSHSSDGPVYFCVVHLDLLVYV